MDFYERIESLRKSKGISQRELEAELGFSNGSISKWRKSTPTMERYQKLAKYFGVSVSYLQTGVFSESDFQEEQDIELSRMNDRLKAYALKLAELSTDKQEHIMGLIDLLGDKK